MIKLNPPKIVVLLLCIAFGKASGQIRPNVNTFSMGINISQYQHDFGVGLHVVSPYFAQSTVAVRLGANSQWLEHLNGSRTIWTAYRNFQLGFRYRKYVLQNMISMYSEGGVLMIVPNSKFSSKKRVVGGYGLFGFEFEPIDSPKFFVELGGAGTGATADKVIGRPIYSNGFLLNSGIRFNI